MDAPPDGAGNDTENSDTTGSDTTGSDDGRRRTRRRRRPASPADMPEHAPQPPDTGASPADMPLHPQPEAPRGSRNGPAGSGDGRNSEADAARPGDSARRADTRPGGDSRPHDSRPHDSTQRDSKPGRDSKQDRAERGLRGLIGAGPSQLPISAAMRARDAARPTEQDLAAADQLPIVRRNYVPPSGEMPR